MVFPTQIKKKHLASYRKGKPVLVQFINHWSQISEKRVAFQHMNIIFVILKLGFGTIVIGSINRYLGFDKAGKDYLYL